MNEQDFYAAAVRYCIAKPEVLLLIVMAAVLIVSIAWFWVTVDAAHLAGVSSYGG